jgi:cyclase
VHNTRVIPVLLFSERRLVKGNQFKDHRYVGDPMNAIKIFNDKEVDEMLLLDIFATKKSKEPDFDYLEKLSSEAFFPIGYGGGVTSLEHVKRITRLGFEKIIFGHEAYSNPDLI